MFAIKKSVVYDMISIAKSQTAEYQRIRLYFLLCSFPSVPAQHFRAWTPPPVQHLLGSASSWRSKTVRILHGKSTNCFPLFFILSPRNVRIKLYLRFCDIYMSSSTVTMTTALTTGNPCCERKVSVVFSQSSEKTIGKGWSLEGSYCFPFLICCLALRLQQRFRPN